MNEISFSDKVLVLDTVHGGDYLAKKLKDIGINSKAINPYDGEKADPREYDKIASPIHLDPTYSVIKNANREKIVSHHELVADLINHYNFLEDIYCIEITGTVGKTSTSLLLGDLLEETNKEIAIHSSNGLKINSEKLNSFSISPAGNLKAIEFLRKRGIDTDVLINEVSLGFLGVSDLAIISSLKNDYLVAGKTFKASEKKLNSVSNLQENCKVISPRDLEGREVFNFRDDLNSFIENDTLKIQFGNKLDNQKITNPINPVLFEFFESSILASILSAKILNIPERKIKEVISSFNGFKGRMEKKKLENDKILIDNSCSGTKIEDLGPLMKYKENKKPILVVGEEEKHVCESLDLEEVEERLKKFDFKHLIGIGERYSEITDENADNHEEGLKRAKEVSDPSDLILSFVKMRR